MIISMNIFWPTSKRQTKVVDWSPSPLQHNMNCRYGQLHNRFVRLPLWSISTTTFHHHWSGIWSQIRNLWVSQFSDLLPILLLKQMVCLILWIRNEQTITQISYIYLISIWLTFFFLSFLLSFCTTFIHLVGSLPLSSTLSNWKMTVNWAVVHFL